MSIDYQVIDNRDFSLRHGVTDALGPQVAPRSVEPLTVDRPIVVVCGDRRVLFGPGLDDINELDDPC